MDLEENQMERWISTIAVIALLVMVFNMGSLSSINTVYAIDNIIGNGVEVPATNTQTDTITVASAGPDIIPKGIPAVYGTELGVNYDDVSANNPRGADATIRTLGNLDRTLELEESNLERYIKILYEMENGMSCEYCCGARSIIFENGESACGCAHSYAMRGLTKYLIIEHGEEYSDEQILEEIGKWKTLFFPTQISQKAAILESEGIELSYINLASNKYRGVEQGVSDSSGGMVGGC